ncbi:MAG: PilX N-terminal domain-containing pilus assembly protein [Aquabacterium sp.]|nr:PilX N-terminal domain-containing pilus assembly protein [Aquabacterium sp.]
MSRPAHTPAALRRRPARGFSLIVILLMMVALAMLALGAMNSSILQERMVGNARDQQVALQAAESAIRDAEIDIELNVNAADGFVAGCANGLCIAPSDTRDNPQSAPLWQTINWAATRAYGSRTGAPALLGPGNVALAAQPRYFVENLPVLPPVAGESMSIGGGSTPAPRARAYRISVRASGIRASTVVMLQSVYVKQ